MLGLQLPLVNVIHQDHCDPECDEQEGCQKEVEQQCQEDCAVDRGQDSEDREHDDYLQGGNPEYASEVAELGVADDYLVVLEEQKGDDRGN